MRVVAVIVGCLLIVVIPWDAFEAFILPRRVSRKFRLARIFYRSTWGLLSGAAHVMAPGRRREKYLGIFGPLSLILLLVMWGVGMILAFALLHWGLDTPLNVPPAGHTFGAYLYMSGVTFLTLGFGDLTPVAGLGRALAVVEAGSGFALLAIVIGYLPVMYQLFARREVHISLLDARAGSPPSATELMMRYGRDESLADLNDLLREWERWSAELLESHLSYPVLGYFRSQHENQSWIGALTVILDTCALVIVGVRGLSPHQAKLTFAMARHALVDLAQTFNTPPAAPDPDRLPDAELAEMRRALLTAGVVLRDGAEGERKLAELRQTYEPYVNALADALFMRLPHWFLHTAKVKDNWQTSAWERDPVAFASTPLEPRRFDYSKQEYVD